MYFFAYIVEPFISNIYNMVCESVKILSSTAFTFWTFFFNITITFTFSATQFTIAIASFTFYDSISIAFVTVFISIAVTGETLIFASPIAKYTLPII